MKIKTPANLTDLTAVHFVMTGNGRYLFIEGSLPRQQRDKADLVSEILPAGHEFCMEFALNMFGVDMGSVDIIIKVSSLRPNLTHLNLMECPALINLNTNSSFIFVQLSFLLYIEDLT